MQVNCEWEYHVARLDYETGGITEYLNERGEDGWELVGPDNGLYIFKRRKVPAMRRESLEMCNCSQCRSIRYAQKQS